MTLKKIIQIHSWHPLGTVTNQGQNLFSLHSCFY